MCGIAGFVRITGTSEVSPQFMGYFAAVLHAIVQRGPDSFGIGEFYGGEVMDPRTKLLKCPTAPLEVDRMLEEVCHFYHGGYVLAGFRGVATTQFWDKADDNCVQPYIYQGDNPAFRGAAVVHNGIIANARALAAAHGYPAPLIDSYLLLPLFADPAGIALIDRLRGLMGGSAFAMYTPVTDELLLARNFRGLSLAVWQRDEETYLVWASELAALQNQLDPQTSLATDEMPPWSFFLSDPRVLHRFNMSPSAYLQTLLDNCVVYQHPPGSDKCAVVCSGGMDSVTVATLACQQFREVHLLHFDYGARARIDEEMAVREVAKWLREHTDTDIHLTHIPLDFLRNLGGSTLTEHHKPLAQGQMGAETSHEWVPARNLTMISLAASYCDRYNISNIALGLNMEEGSVFEDNSQEFYLAAEKALQMGTKSRPSLWLPLINSMKHHIVRIALDVKAPLDLSWSCYEAGPIPCGTCGSCTERRRAFRMNGVEDPLSYATNQPLGDI